VGPPGRGDSEKIGLRIFLKLSGGLLRKESVMRTTTMNGKLNLLDDMAQVLAAPRTKRPVIRPTPEVRIRPTKPSVRVNRRAAGRPLWKTSLESARDTVAEQLLRWTLIVTVATALLWSGYTLMQFVFAWSHLVTWVRSAML
jgi:hypothetical protein